MCNLSGADAEFELPAEVTGPMKAVLITNEGEAPALKEQMELKKWQCVVYEV